MRVFFCLGIALFSIAIAVVFSVIGQAILLGVFKSDPIQTSAVGRDFVLFYAPFLAAFFSISLSTHFVTED